MKLIPFEPGGFLEGLKSQLDKLFGLDSNFLPNLTADIQETDGELIVRWQIPACDDIRVYVDKQILTVVGTTRQFKEDGGTKVSYSGQFTQRLHLPVKVRGEQTQTNYRDGVLEVIIDRQ